MAPVKCNVGGDATGQKKEMLVAKVVGKKSKVAIFSPLSVAKMSHPSLKLQLINLVAQTVLVNGSLESGLNGQILMKSNSKWECHYNQSAL